MAFYQTNKFSPHMLGVDDTTGMLSWFDSDWDLTLQAGTEDDMRRIQSAPSLAFFRSDKPGLGSSFDQVTIANRPQNTSFPEGRAAFCDGSNDRVIFSGSAASFRPLIEGPGSVGWVARPLSTNGVMWGCGVHGAASSVVAHKSGNDLQFITRNGANTASTATWSSVFSGSSTRRLVLSFTGSNAELWVNGVSAGTQAVAGVAGNPSQQLSIGADHTASAPFQGWISEHITYNKALNAYEAIDLDGFLARATLSVSWADLATSRVSGLFELFRAYHSSGSAWVDRLGIGTATPAGTPTHGTSASYNNTNVATLNGTTQWFADDAAALEIDGDDIPVSMIVCADGLTNRFAAAFGDESSSNARNTIASGTNWAYDRKGDSAAGATPAIGAFAASTPARVIACYANDVADGYLNGVRGQDGTAAASGSASFDTFRMGSLRAGATDIAPWSGRLADVLLSRRRLNMGDAMAIDRAIAIHRGLAT